MKILYAALLALSIAGGGYLVYDHHQFIHHWDEAEAPIGSPDLCIECHLEE